MSRLASACHGTTPVDGAVTSAGLVAEAARRLQAELSELAGQMAAAAHQKVPGLPGAEGERAPLRASCAASAQTLLDVLRHDIPLDRVSVPAATAHYARLVAQSDLPVDSLLRAQRMGEDLARRRWYHAAAEREPVGVLPLEFVQDTEQAAAGYSDRICRQLADIYAQERTRWTQQPGSVQAARVRDVLQDISMSTAAAEAMTGHRMRGSHLGVIAWVDAPEHAVVLRTATAVLAEVTGHRPLAVPANERTLWAWLSTPQPLDVDLPKLETQLRRRCPVVRLVLGNPARDLPGWRATHQDARKAHHMARVRADPRSRVTVYGEVVLPSFLAQDLPRARRWITTVLGQLAADDPAMAELRETVLTFLRTGQSLTETAPLLRLHKNTVRYRLRKAERLRGAPISDDRLNLEIALLACDHLQPTRPDLAQRGERRDRARPIRPPGRLAGTTDVDQRSVLQSGSGRAPAHQRCSCDADRWARSDEPGRPSCGRHRQ
jgi:DNA-binding PucR family transcriptional regulator